MSEDRAHVPVVVISQHTLVREGVKTLLAGSPYAVRENFNTIAEAISSPCEAARLLFIGAALDSELAGALGSLRSAYPGRRIVVYTQALRLPPKRLLDLLDTSLDGCLTSDTSGEAILQSLDLIMMGEPVFPLSLLLAASRLYVHHEHEPAAATRHGFSQRERQILEHLCEGSSNKAIARALYLSEATVKIHVKTLLGKIGVPNRTQAAIWATTNRAHWERDRADLAADSAQTADRLSARPQ